MELLTVHTATVETFLGASTTGDTYAAPASVTGFLDDGVVLTGAPGGEQLESKTIFYTALGNAPLFTPESKFSCNGRDMQVKATRRRDGGSLLEAVEHLEVDFG